MITKENSDIIRAPQWNELASKCHLKQIHQILSESDGTSKNILEFVIEKKDAIIPQDILEIFEYLRFMCLIII